MHFSTRYKSRYHTVHRSAVFRVASKGCLQVRHALLSFERPLPNSTAKINTTQSTQSTQSLTNNQHNQHDAPQELDTEDWRQHDASLRFYRWRCKRRY